MSELRNVLVLVNDSPRSRAVATLGARLAADHQAEVAVLYAATAATIGAYVTPEAASLGLQMQAEADAARRERVTARVAEAAQATGAPLQLRFPAGEPLPTVLQQSRCTDLIVLGQRDPVAGDGTPAGFAGQLLTGAACPLLFVPYVNADGAPADEPPRCGSRVLVAWSDTRESARALRDALPLLRRAQKVDLVRFAHEDDETDRNLDAVAAHLQRHGVQAECTVRRTRADSVAERMTPSWTPDAPVAQAVLSHASDIDADLIVMGGYGHPRLWELVLGGVTRTLLQSMTVPVLMSH